MPVGSSCVMLLPGHLRRWKRGVPRKLCFSVCSRARHGVGVVWPSDGDEGGVWAWLGEGVVRLRCGRRGEGLGEPGCDMEEIRLFLRRLQASNHVNQRHRPSIASSFKNHVKNVNKTQSRHLARQQQVKETGGDNVQVVNGERAS